MIILFDRDDLDWAMGELLHLFYEANFLASFPHKLNPDLFYSAWSILCYQPFEVAVRCCWILSSVLTYPLRSKIRFPSLKPYENPDSH